VLALTAAAVALSLFALCMATPRVILGLVGLRLVTMWEFPLGPGASVGGATVYADDLLATVLVASAFLSRDANPRALTKPVPGFAACLTLLLLARGVLTQGQAALQEARPFIYLLAVAMWALSQPWHLPAWQRAGRRFAALTGIGLGVVMVVHIAQYGLGGVEDFVVSGTGEVQTGRPLVATQALFICVLMLKIFGGDLQGRGWRVLLGVSALVVLIAQHRSVWVSAALGVVAIMVMARKPGQRFRAAAGITLAGLVLLAGTRGVAKFHAWVTDATTRLGTLEARGSDASTLLMSSREWSLVDRLLGQPFGTGFGRYADGAFVEFTPHNWYVLVYLRLGIPGLILVAVMAIKLVSWGRQRRSAATIGAVAALIAFGLAYSVPWQVLPLLALMPSREARPPSPVSADTAWQRTEVPASRRAANRRPTMP
jgi:hypothetical protein